MHTVVVFLPHNARVEKVGDPTSYLHYQDVLIDPDLTSVKDLPPHFWKLDNGHVVPMTYEEREARMNLLSDSAKKGVKLSNVPEKKTIQDALPKVESKSIEKPLLPPPAPIWGYCMLTLAVVLAAFYFLGFFGG